MNPAQKESKSRPYNMPLDIVQKTGSGLSGIMQASEIESTLMLLNAVGDGVLGVDRDGYVVYANQSARTLLGYSAAELLGKKLEEFLEKPSAAHEIFDPVLQGDVVSTDEVLYMDRKATKQSVIVIAVPLLKEQIIQGAMVIFRDITPGVILNRTLKEREELLKGIFHLLPSGIMLTAQDGTVVRINEAARGFLGISETELRGEPFPADHWNAFDREGNPIPLEEAPFNRAAKTGNAVLEQVIRLGEAPFERFLLLSASVLYMQDGDVETNMVVTTITDVNRQLKAQSRLETAVQLNGQINNLLKNLLTETGPEETIEIALRGVCSMMRADIGMLGILDDDRQKVVFDHIHGLPEVFRGHSAPYEGSLCEAMVIIRSPMIIQKYADHPRQMEQITRSGARTFLGAPILADSDPIGCVCLFRKTDEPFSEEDRENLMVLAPVLSAALYKATYERRLREYAANDSLTGIWNRRVFFEHLELEIERAKRYGSKMSLLVIDLDYFKQVNDTYGHQAGDQVLIAFSELLKKITRRTDMVGRTGGEEFMVVLPDTALSGAIKTAEKLRKDFAAFVHEHNGRVISNTVSIGCAEFQKGETLEEIYARADRLLYHAKNSGRNQVAWGQNL